MGNRLSPRKIRQTLRARNQRLNRKMQTSLSSSNKMCRYSQSHNNKIFRANPHNKHLTSRSQLSSLKTRRRVTSSGFKTKCWEKKSTTPQLNLSNNAVTTKTLNTNTTSSRDNSKKRQTKLNSWEPILSPTSLTRSLLTQLKGLTARSKKKT